jgi:esterase/lipase
MLNTRRRLPQVDAPLLLIFARHDQVVTLDALDYIWQRVASTSKQRLVLERGGHIIPEDYDQDAAFVAIEQFLQRYT